MKTQKLVGFVVLAALIAASPVALAQRGLGDEQGVVRQGVETERVSVEGKIKEIVVEECENTTGPFAVGMHLLVTTAEDKQYNVHLGPAVLIKGMIEPLKTDQAVTVQAFRTEKMAADDLVAVELKFGAKTVRLRDENLRPVWAGGRGGFFRQYDDRSDLPRLRQGYGRGYGMGYGQGSGAGYGRGMGRGGYGRGVYGSKGYGRGWGSGMGYGRGWGCDMGYGRGRGGAGSQGRGPGFGYGQRTCPWDNASGYPRYYGWR